MKSISLPIAGIVAAAVLDNRLSWGTVGLSGQESSRGEAARIAVPGQGTSHVVWRECAAAREPRFNPDAFERRLAMLGSRLMLGAVIGGAAVYFFDPVNGAERRSRLQARWEQHREPILNTAGQVATSAREGAAQLNDQATAKAAELKARVQNGGAEKPGAL